MEVSIIFKIGAVGILVSVLSQVPVSYTHLPPENGNLSRHSVADCS